MVAWVKTISYEDAEGPVRDVYDRVIGQRPEPDNLYRAHSLRPETVLASDHLYKAVLHCNENSLPKWLAELISAYTALLCGCEYAVENHRANFRAFLDDPNLADRIWQAIENDGLEEILSNKERAMLRYTAKLTLTPKEMSRQDVEKMRQAGADDGEIVEVNQLCASFNYFVRVLNGLGVARDSGPPGLQADFSSK